MTENKAAEFFDNLFGPDRNRVNEARYRMKEQAAFFELVEHQKTIEVETNPIEDFLWWMDISKECLDGYVQNNIGYNVIPNLKKNLVNYCRSTYIWQRINENIEGKISLFNDFAYFNIFYFKSVLGGKADYVENGRRVYVDSFQWCEENQECSIMQHEAFPFIEIQSSENIYSELLNESRYKKLYNEAIKDSDFCNSPVVYERLKLIYASIMKIESAEPELNKWKSLLLAYIPDNIKIEIERDMVTKTVEETIDKIEETDTEEDEKSNELSVLERLMYFYYTTGYWGGDLKKHSVLFGKLNASSVESKFKKLSKIERIFEKEVKSEKKVVSKEKLKPYKTSLEKIKNLLYDKNAMSVVIEKIEDRIKICKDEIDRQE